MAAALAAATALAFSSCSGSKKAEADTAQLQEAAEEPAAPVDTAKYSAAFFNDSTLKSDKATADTYAVTESGLRYAVVTPGTGKSPSAESRVKVHYTGKLLDGTVFDSSVQRGEPITFPLQGVIKGWTEGLQLMKEGGTTVFYIPSNLAYGEQGTPGGPIPPNAPLIFEVQLLEVDPAN